MQRLSLWKRDQECYVPAPNCSTTENSRLRTSWPAWRTNNRPVQWEFQFLQFKFLRIHFGSNFVSINEWYSRQFNKFPSVSSFSCAHSTIMYETLHLTCKYHETSVQQAHDIDISNARKASFLKSHAKRGMRGLEVRISKRQQLVPLFFNADILPVVYILLCISLQ